MAEGTAPPHRAGAYDPAPDLTIEAIDPTLYNRDLAPVDGARRSWGWFEIFNVWSNAVQSLFGYTLAASLFLTSGLNGWAVFAAIALAGAIVMVLVNLAGNASVRYGIPYPVMARASMGVRGANVPALVRGTVAIFWYGAQTYIASTAVALLIGTFVAADGGATFLGMTAVGWVAFVIVWSFQMVLFWNGIDWIRVFLNWAAPAVYAVMIALLLTLWVRAGSGLLAEVGSIFEGSGTGKGGAFAAFTTVVGTMVAYFAAVILNFGDFSRYVRSTADMRLGNLLGLPVSLAFFSLIALFVTAGTVVVFGAHLTDPTAIIRRVDSPLLTVVAALTFFVATVGINVVANFVPPANDLSNLMPGRISFRIGGLIAASFAFVVGALWVTAIGQLGIARFVNTLGAILAPAYGIMFVDFYLIKHGVLDIRDLYSSAPGGAYAYDRGWNRRGLVAFAVAAVFSVSAVWLPAVEFLTGFDWVIGAVLGGAIYYAVTARPA
jgi:NCS1 family nucleobase:cation symporter-1